MKETQYKTIFVFIEKMFIRLLTSIVNVLNQKKCISLNNRQCMTRPTFINLYPIEYSRGLKFHRF